ncbi:MULTISPECIES: NucA/NucB deoxyribonuclease domain-containing protein [unclassified Streptomyces]|uniref:NucA/NucB deoxyribonuclease domain-containing protein n=1 Tax=unclassified Streptomyces TaxID=2593676 RepID=UPI00131B172C|nr:NucA/NucB deoxyribonuclease domain-containing protein [Streptomyces sp. CB01635]
MSLEPAGAASTSEKGPRVVSTVGALGASLPSLRELRQDWTHRRTVADANSLNASSTAGETPLETVGPAAAWASESDEPAAVAPGGSGAQRARTLAADDSLYPEPAHTMTAQECRDGLGSDKKFFIKSRFAVCSGASFTQEWIKDNKPVGASTFGFLAIGTIAKGSRTMNVQYRYVQMQTTGTTGVSTFMITPSVTIPQIWPATAKTSQGGSVPVAQSFAALKAQTEPGFQHNLTVASGQGDPPDDTVFAVYQPKVKLRVDGGWKMNGALSGEPFFLAPRWDKAQYVSPDNGAAAMSYTVAMPFSTKTDAPERLAAQHIKDAYDKPGTTKPDNTSKDIPGRTADRPLTRLYADTSRRNANRRAAVATCKKYWGDNYADGGNECDEFPFSTTYEGAAQASAKYDPQGKAPKNNYSARPIPKTDNGAGGTLMSLFYKYNRIIDGPNDGFLVEVN